MYETKDSGVRSEYDSGMVRDSQDGKARFDLLWPKNVPYSEQMLTRFAELMERGANKYTERNWEKANSQDELDRYYASAERHLHQWTSGETDEDHAAAIMFNILAAETVKYKMFRYCPVEGCEELPEDHRHTDPNWTLDNHQITYNPKARRCAYKWCTTCASGDHGPHVCSCYYAENSSCPARI